MHDAVKKGDALLREMNLKRADFKCEVCGTDQDTLDNHHFLPKSVYPQHRFNPDGTAILCRRRCHFEAENYPDQFLASAVQIERLQDRVLWHDINKGIGKYPSEVDYDDMFDDLQALNVMDV